MLKHGFQVFFCLWLLLASSISHAADLTHCQMRKDYQTSIRKVTNRAAHYLENHPATQTQHDNIFFWRNANKIDAIVFDIDETLLSNWQELDQTHCLFNPKHWAQWVEQAQATAIQPTIDLLHTAQKQGYAIILMTGRYEHHREATIRNLKAVGINHWNKLILKSDNEAHVSDCSHKARNKALLGKHYRIVMNIGDQVSDYCGSHNGIVLKLPNPFYTIPTLPGDALEQNQESID
jgi:5'-nucleotidase (lipoprotein e(P4) family)